MSDKPKTLSPPYATFSSFLNFLNKLRDTGLPARIDASLFGNGSGSISYSVIAALKFLKLVDENGKPTQQFAVLVKATDEKRPAFLKEVVQNGYPSLFKDGMNLKSMTPAQFDEHMREVFDVQGSTIDKIATFFISAAKEAGIELSPHLAARKPIATSSSSRKSVKQRKREEQNENLEGADTNKEKISEPQKALEYQLIDLMSEPDIDDTVKGSIWSLVQYLMARKKNI